MFEYIIILIAAIIVVALTFLLIKRKKLQRSSLFIVLSGVFIALVGSYIGQNFPFYYTLIAMFGLAFALSVLLDKQFAGKEAVVEEELMLEILDKRDEESELQRFIKEDEAATIEEDIQIPEPTDKDEEMWMSDTLTDIIIPEEEEEVRSGK